VPHAYRLVRQVLRDGHDPTGQPREGNRERCLHRQAEDDRGIRECGSGIEPALGQLEGDEEPDLQPE
jgi:hypothetical protein